MSLISKAFTPDGIFGMDKGVQVYTTTRSSQPVIASMGLAVALRIKKT
jgi:hypothetical protein